MSGGEAAVAARKGAVKRSAARLGGEAAGSGLRVLAHF